MKIFLVFLLSFAQAFGATGGITPGTYGPGLSSLKNYVKNPDCAANILNVTASGGSLTKGTTTPLNGDTGSECVIDASSSGQTYTWSLNTLGQDLKGQNCEAKFVYEGAGVLYKAYVKNSTNKVTSDIQLQTPTASQPFAVNFPCGDLSAANTLVIEATSSSAAAISVAKVYVGEATNLSNVSQASFVGSVVISACAGGWTTSSTSFTNFSVQTSCAYSVSGSAAAPATMVPGISFASLAPGEYKIEYEGNFTQSTSGKNTYLRFSDGTNVAREVSITGGPATMSGNTISQSIAYTTSQTNVTLQIQGKTDSGGTAGIYGITGFTGTIKVWRFPLASELVSRPSNSLDVMGQVFYTASSTCPVGSVATDGAAISRTGYASLYSRIGTTFGVGDGSTTFNVPDTRGIFVRGSGTHGSLANANGTAFSGTLGTYQNDKMQGHIHKTSIQQNGGAGSPFQAVTGAAGSPVIFDSLGPVTDGTNGTPRTGLETNPANVGLLGCISTASIPVPLLVGSVSSNSSGQERVERAVVETICSASPCTVTSKSGNWLTSITRGVAGTYTLNIPAGMFSATPTCVCSAQVTGSAFAYCSPVPLGNSATSVVLATSTGVTTAADTAFYVMCMGPR